MLLPIGYRSCYVKDDETRSILKDKLEAWIVIQLVGSRIWIPVTLYHSKAEQHCSASKFSRRIAAGS